MLSKFCWHECGAVIFLCVLPTGWIYSPREKPGAAPSAFCRCSQLYPFQQREVPDTTSAEEPQLPLSGAHLAEGEQTRKVGDIAVSGLLLRNYKCDGLKQQCKMNTKVIH